MEPNNYAVFSFFNTEKFDFKQGDENHLKSKYLPKYYVSWVEFKLELNVIKFFTKKNWKSVIARLLDTHIYPPPAKNVYFPLGATEFFQTHPNVFE